MSITFYYGKDSESIANELAKHLKKDTQSDPFYSPAIIANNKNMIKWLKFKLAKANGIAINYNFKFLEKTLYELTTSLMDESLEKEYIFLGEHNNQLDLQLLIMSIIYNDTNKNFYELKNYLGNQTNSPVFYAKLWKIAEKLAKLFREYEYHREEMINKWLSDKLYFENNNIELMQKEIYCKIFGKEGIISNFNSNDRSREYITLPQFKNRFLNSTFTPQNETIYLFGFSQISRFHYELLNKLSDYFDFKVFQLNLLDGIEKSDEINDFLINIAKPAIDNEIILKEVLGNTYTVTSLPQAQKSQRTVLSELQKSITNGVANMQKLDQDKSVQIIGCPGINREVEAIYNSILYNIDSNPDLKLTDIAVLVPNMSDYANEIKVIFGESDIKLPYNMSDASADQESIFA